MVPNESFAVFLIFAIISFFIYNHSKLALAFENYFDPKRISEDIFESLMVKPDPCYAVSSINLIYTLPADKITLAINRLAVSGCFYKEKPFLKAVEAAIEAKHEKSLVLSLIPVALKYHHSVLPLVFYKCASTKFYLCTFELLYHCPLMEYNGRNIIHLAALLDDLILIDTAPLNSLYLHLRDNEGNFPTNYVKSVEMYNEILKRSEIEASITPYPKEHKANLDYLKKSKELGFQTTIKTRFDAMLINPNWIPSNILLNLEVPRETIFKYSYKMIHSYQCIWYNPYIFARFFISFVNEEGVDKDGVTNDWLSALVEIFFKKNPLGDAKSFTAPLFQPVSDDSNIYQPTGLYDPSVYKFAGSIVALALSKGITTRVEFIPSLCRQILEIEPYRVEDLQVQNPIVYKNLNSLRDLFKRNVPLIDHDFKSIDEVERYIESYSADLLYNSHKKFLKAFAEGFRSKIPRKISKYLGLTDLKNVLRGTVIITTEDFKNNLEFRTESPKKKEIFLRVIDQLSLEERFKLIRFITGIHGLPFGGLSELPQKILVFFNWMPFGKLPMSSTCFSSLFLPTFYNEEELKASLLKAIDYCITLEEN